MYIEKACEEVKNTLLRKREDYGDYRNTIGRFGLKGIVVRLTDKMERLINLTWGNHPPNYETLYDTLLDIAGYAVLGMCEACEEGLRDD